MIVQNIITGELNEAIVLGWYNKPIPKCQPKIQINGRGGGEVNEELGRQFRFYSGSKTDQEMAVAAGIQDNENTTTETCPF